MTREGKALVISAAAGTAIGLALCLLFGVFDVQCYGIGRQNWNPTLQTCD